MVVIYFLLHIENYDEEENKTHRKMSICYKNQTTSTDTDAP